LNFCFRINKVQHRQSFVLACFWRFINDILHREKSIVRISYSYLIYKRFVKHQKLKGIWVAVQKNKPCLFFSSWFLFFSINFDSYAVIFQEVFLQKFFWRWKILDKQINCVFFWIRTQVPFIRISYNKVRISNKFKVTAYRLKDKKWWYISRLASRIDVEMCLKVFCRVLCRFVKDFMSVLRVFWRFFRILRGFFFNYFRDWVFFCNGNNYYHSDDC
jgi:hypothetical protein